MRIFPAPLEIGDTEGFTAEKDIFGRKALGGGLTNLITRVTDPTVIAIDGQWGSGKTTFLKMWAGELRRQGFPVIYFDAFQNDYSEDAFTALAGEIVALAEMRRKADTPKAKEFLDKARGAGKVLLRSGLKIGIRAATLGAMTGGEFDEVASAMADEAAKLEDKYIGEMLTSQRERKSAIDAFRQALEELPELLTQAPESNRAGDVSPVRPLVIIIDELDRCRPVFALEILERMKHFFSVPHVHFVLGTHRGQLENSVKAAYGADIDARTYLQKFIQLTLHLVDNKRHRHERVATTFINYLTRALEFNPKDSETVEYTQKLINNVADGCEQAPPIVRAGKRLGSLSGASICRVYRIAARRPPRD